MLRAIAARCVAYAVRAAVRCTPRVVSGVRRVLLSVVRRVSTVSISIQSVRTRCEAERRDGLTRQRHAACVCDDRMDALQGSGRQLAPEATRTG